jgi:hypothetical protein
MTKLASAEALGPPRLPSGLKHRGGGVEILRKLGYRNAGTFEKWTNSYSHAAARVEALGARPQLPIPVSPKRLGWRSRC